MVAVHIQAYGELQANGKREVFFEANGVPRIVEIFDVAASKTDATKAARVKAETGAIGSVGAPMGGEVVDVVVKPGTEVAAGAPLVIMSAMKMETTVSAPIAGQIKHVAVIPGDVLEGGDLLIEIRDQNSATLGSG